VWNLPGGSEREELHPNARMRLRFVSCSCSWICLPLTDSCVPCLSSGWTLAITEGSLENVFCPSVACTKERALKEEKTENEHKVITAELVESVVGKTLRERWEWVKENRIMETGKLHSPSTCSADF
jgi:hypothetical protein